MKRFIAIFVAVLMLTGIFSVCTANAVAETEPAYVLFKLGLFNGTGTDDAGNPVFSLDNKLSRQEAAALLVRLLGKEAVAKAEVLPMPFTDVDDWAKPYVSYAYNNGIVNGVGEATFGSANSISATEYLTLVLRALGHDDTAGDFAWDAAWLLSDSLGMTAGQYNGLTNGEFYRKDAALIAYMALQQKLKGEEQALAGNLLSGNVFSEEQLMSTNDAAVILAAKPQGALQPPAAGNMVAAVTGISFEERGVYVKMTLVQPEDKTGIVGYEALIYDKNNPATAVHRTITLEDGTAHYRLDDPTIFVPGCVYNTIKVTSNSAEGYAPAVWEHDILIQPVHKDIAVTGAKVINDDEIAVDIAGAEKGYMGYIFARKDGSIVDEDTFFKYMGTTARYSNNLKNWSNEDKTALENGEITVAVTGMNIVKLTDDAGIWHIEFECIKSIAAQVVCDVDIVN